MQPMSTFLRFVKLKAKQRIQEQSAVETRSFVDENEKGL